MVLPGGNTRERNRGRGVVGGGWSPSVLAQIYSVEIATDGTSADFGDLTLQRRGTGAAASHTRGVWAGGYAPGYQDRIDFVTIVVQNHLHFDVAKTFLHAGFNVICDKPVTYDLAQARELRKIINKTKKVFALTHNYTGYPMVKLAREMVKKGELGEIIKVVCEYPQGYAITALTGEE